MAARPRPDFFKTAPAAACFIPLLFLWGTLSAGAFAAGTCVSAAADVLRQSQPTASSADLAASAGSTGAAQSAGSEAPATSAGAAPSADPSGEPAGRSDRAARNPALPPQPQQSAAGAQGKDSHTMKETSKADYSILDVPQVLSRLFHPRPESHLRTWEHPPIQALIPVEKDVVVGARFHMSRNDAPSILFFHGNGEIAADYDDLGPIYTGMGMNFLAVDYRGYGQSTGSPSVGAMMRDCHEIYRYVRNWLKENSYTGPFIVMGRSLGSASALELASSRGDEIDGLIIESGFARIAPLLELLGLDPQALGFKEENGPGNLEKIRAFEKPTLVIHAELDHIIPYADGDALYQASPAKDKRILQIPRANHNDIFQYGLPDYMAEVKLLSDRVVKGKSGQP